MWLLISLCWRAQLLLKSYFHSSSSILFFWSSHLLFSSETSPFKISNSAFKLSSSQSLLTLQLAAYPLFFRVLRFSLIFLTSPLLNLTPSLLCSGLWWGLEQVPHPSYLS